MYLYTYTIHFHKCVSSSTRCNGCVDNCRNPSTKPSTVCIKISRDVPMFCIWFWEQVVGSI